MADPTNRQWVLAERPTGAVGPGTFRWTGTRRPGPPGEGHFLVRNLWLSFDPTQYLSLANESAGAIPIGSVMRGLAVSQVVDSRHPNFRAGDIVHGFSGWEDYSVLDGKGFFETARVPPNVAPNLAAGTFGATGMAAYFGVVDVARPKAGETFVVSAAAGGVGSIAGQIARILGARVVGIAGGKAKCDWLLGEGRFDAAIDHRTEKVPDRLDVLCPDGIDMYFDNVGGPILDDALARLRTGARVVICGGTSLYAAQGPTVGPSNYFALCMVRGRMEGIIARDYADRFPVAFEAIAGWLRSGELRSKEDVLVGLEHAPEGLARLFRGENVGKQLVKIADPEPSPPE